MCIDLIVVRTCGNIPCSYLKPPWRCGAVWTSPEVHLVSSESLWEVHKQHGRHECDWAWATFYPEWIDLWDPSQDGRRQGHGTDPAADRQVVRHVDFFETIICQYLQCTKTWWMTFIHFMVSEKLEKLQTVNEWHVHRPAVGLWQSRKPLSPHQPETLQVTSRAVKTKIY